MHVSPFDDETYWEENIMCSTDKSADLLNLLTQSLLLRRTKDQTCPVTNEPLVDLKPKIYKRHDLVLKGDEGAAYAVMFNASKQKFQKMLNDADMAEYEKLYGRQMKQADDKVINPFPTKGMLTILLRLRQACVHMHLTKEAVEMDAFEHLGGEDADEDAFVEKTMTGLTLYDDSNETDATNNTAQIFELSFVSCKLSKTLKIIEDVLERGEKIVVVSQWASLLEIVEHHLKKREASYTVISGEILPAIRQKRVDAFNETTGGPSIMLLSLRAGGVGLDLVGGNHLIMMDPHWNPALEAQACDRIYRIGQNKPVYIHRLITRGTIEQRVVALQDKKKALAATVLDGAYSEKMQLSIQDMRYLFEDN